MDRSSVLKLITETVTTDSFGQQISSSTSRSVYCDLRSVTRSEWATAGQMGLSPELVARMFSWDYQGEAEAELIPSVIGTNTLQSGSAVRYGIYRTYQGADETIELYLERKAGVTTDV